MYRFKGGKTKATLVVILFTVFCVSYYKKLGGLRFGTGFSDNSNKHTYIMGQKYERQNCLNCNLIRKILCEEKFCLKKTFV